MEEKKKKKKKKAIMKKKETSTRGKTWRERERERERDRRGPSGSDDFFRFGSLHCLPIWLSAVFGFPSSFGSLSKTPFPSSRYIGLINIVGSVTRLDGSQQSSQKKVRTVLTGPFPIYKFLGI